MNGPPPVPPPRAAARNLAAGLAVNAYVHADLASRYDPVSATMKDLVVISQVLTVVATTVLLVGRGHERLLTRRSASGH